MILTRMLCSQLIAKLHISRKRARPNLSGGINDKDSVNNADKSASQGKDSEWIYGYDPNAHKIREHLDKYMESAGNDCDPKDFQEYMLEKSNATSLSYIAKKLAEILFDEEAKKKVDELIATLDEKVDKLSQASLDVDKLKDLKTPPPPPMSRVGGNRGGRTKAPRSSAFGFAGWRKNRERVAPAAPLSSDARATLSAEGGE